MAYVVSVVGPSGSGKTTLIERLIRELTGRGVAVAAVKCTHHGFELDRDGKDSYRLKQAGSVAVGLVSPGGWAVIADEAKVSLDDLLRRLPACDLVIIEGGTESDTPKIEIIPPPGTLPSKSSPDEQIALVGKDLQNACLPCFDRDDISGITKFLIHSSLQGKKI